MLRSIAGLEQPDEGLIISEERTVYSSAKGIRIPPERRGFGMMFQSYAVWPHMDVFGNVSYPLRIKHVPKTEVKERVEQVLKIVGIDHLRDEYPTRMSGGQQQRVALARCLVADPRVILFDEPLSNVDAKVREELRGELRRMQHRIGFAGIFVTHDQEEATAIADRIVVMRDGDFVQVGNPREVYGSPANRFVAGFLGVVNEWQGTLLSSTSVHTELGDLVIRPSAVPAGAKVGDSVVVAVRPEGITVGLSLSGEGAVWKAVAEEEVFRGPYVDRFLTINGKRFRARGDSSLQIPVGTEVEALVTADSVKIVEYGVPATKQTRPEE
jgi:iron(III) transport system ATP-binding protein